MSMLNNLVILELVRRHQAESILRSDWHSVVRAMLFYAGYREAGLSLKRNILPSIRIRTDIWDDAALIALEKRRTST